MRISDRSDEWGLVRGKSHYEYTYYLSVVTIKEAARSNNHHKQGKTGWCDDGYRIAERKQSLRSNEFHSCDENEELVCAESHYDAGNKAGVVKKEKLTRCD